MKKLHFIILFGLIPLFSISQTNDCKSITKEVDDFDGQIRFGAEITKLTDKNIVSFVRYKKKDSDKTYLIIYTAENDIYTGTGVIIILNDGTKISKPKQKVDYKLMGDQFYTRAFIILDEEDISLLKGSGIKKFKLYISTGEISDDDSEKSKELINCLTIAE